MTPNAEFQDADILRYGYYYCNNFERKTNFLQKCQPTPNCPLLYYLIHNVISIITEFAQTEVIAFENGASVCTEESYQQEKIVGYKNKNVLKSKLY